MPKSFSEFGKLKTKVKDGSQVWAAPEVIQYQTSQDGKVFDFLCDIPVGDGYVEIIHSRELYNLYLLSPLYHSRFPFKEIVDRLVNKPLKPAKN